MTDDDDLRLARVVADDPGTADDTLDLRGLALDASLAALDAVFERPDRSLRVLIDPPRGDGAVTLFAPLARRLLALRRTRTLSRLVVLDQGAGFWIRIR
ncbi:MAG TPA: hypothetical protein PKA64_05425 [Myxococcota bacterium]|nr:hypothetical protein [Myxococcota bacterium]